MTTYPDLLAAATDYATHNLVSIACGKGKEHKAPVIGTWKQYQSTPPTDAELRAMFANPRASRIGVVCGAVSGGLEVIDVDTKNDPTGTLADRLWADLLDYFNNHMPLIPVRTQSGGFHLYYRCDVVEQNQSLAVLAATAPKAVIETRGEGGYVIAPPSPGYEELKTQITTVQRITPDQRADILDICRKYNEVFKTEKVKPAKVQASAYAETPWDAYNADPDQPWRTVLEDAGWEVSFTDGDKEYWTISGSDNRNKANFDTTRNLLYIHSTSTAFEAGRAYPPHAIHAVLKCRGDYAESARQLRAAGYGQPFTETDEKYIRKATALIEHGLSVFDIIDRLSQDYILAKANPDLSVNDVEKHVTTIAETAQKRKAQEDGLFWTYGKRGSVSISERGLADFLSDHGFRLFVQDSESGQYRVVRIDHATRIIEETPKDVIKKYARQWLTTNADDFEQTVSPVIDAVVAFKEWANVIDHLDRLCIADIHFMRDTAHDCYIPFSNAVVHITADDIETIPYHALPPGMFIWKKQIKPEKIDIMGINSELQLNQSPVYRFIKRVAGLSKVDDLKPMTQIHQENPATYTRIFGFMTALGYIMSNYKDPGQPYALVLAEDTDNDSDGGGAGKDLLMKCAAKIRGMTTMPGSTWDGKATFAFQTYKLGDDILYISDVEKSFNFKVLYNAISEGLTVERKNKDALVIPYDLSPKVALSTNYNIDDTSGHAGRRQIRLLLTKYYGKHRKVEDDLGGQFWSDSWKHADWMMFYRVMFECIRLYIAHGIVTLQDTENMKAKSVKLATGDDFYEWAHATIPDFIGKWVRRTELHQAFLAAVGQQSKDYSAHRFGKSCQTYAEKNGLVYSAKQWNSRNEPGRRGIFHVCFYHRQDPIPEMTTENSYTPEGSDAVWN